MLAAWMPFEIAYRKHAAALGSVGKMRKLAAVAHINRRLHLITFFKTMSIRHIPFRQLLCAVAIAEASLLPASAASDGGAAFLEKLSLNASPTSVLVVCHGFGCARRDTFPLTAGRVAMLRGILGSAKSANDERKALAKVVAWFDREGGRTAGTVGRIARASAATRSGPTQMDCIDLTANVTELLIVLERNKMLKFHHVGEPVSRGIFVDGKQPHTTAVIVENAGGTQWSVDSWTRAYGQNPDIMTITEWKSKS
jgi:hypothetical protein